MSKKSTRTKFGKKPSTRRQCRLESLERPELMSVNSGAEPAVHEANSFDDAPDYVVASHLPGKRVQVSLDSHGSGTLNVVGTNKADDIVITQKSGGQVVVKSDGEVIHRTRRGVQINRVTVDGHGGDDRIENDTSIYSVITGGRGNDTLIGGSGTDTLVGQRGDDILNGRRGDDSLVGGSGKDKFDGGRGNDSADWRSGEKHDSVEKNSVPKKTEPVVSEGVSKAEEVALETQPTKGFDAKNQDADKTNSGKLSVPDETNRRAADKHGASRDGLQNIAEDREEGKLKHSSARIPDSDNHIKSNAKLPLLTANTNAIQLAQSDGGTIVIQSIRSDISVTRYLANGTVDKYFGFQNSIYDRTGTTKINFQVLISPMMR